MHADGRNAKWNLGEPLFFHFGKLRASLDLARGDQFHWKPDACELLSKAATDSILRELSAR